MSSDEGVHISMAAHEIVSAINRFCELAKDYPRYALGERNDLRAARQRLAQALWDAENEADDVQR